MAPTVVALTLDSLLVLTVLLASWAFIKAAESGKLWWLGLGAVGLGLGFNIKAAQVLLVFPALYLFYLVAAPLNSSSRPRLWRGQLIRLVGASMLFVVVALAWVVAVDLTPAQDRPIIDSTLTNSALELALVQNGIGRLDTSAYFAPVLPFSNNTSQVANPGVIQSSAGIQKPGPLRFLSPAIGGQIGWLLPLALFGMGLELFLFGLKFKRGQSLTSTHQNLILWGSWLLTQLLYFSFAPVFLLYYLTMLAPAVAALAGITLSRLIRLHTEAPSLKSWQFWLLPAVLLIEVAAQLNLISTFPPQVGVGWLIPLIGSLALITGAGLIAPKLKTRLPKQFLAGKWVSYLTLTTLFLSLLLTPTFWSLTSVLGYGDAAQPNANPAFLKRSPPPDQLAPFQDLATYLENQHNQERFILVTLSTRIAGPLILTTSQPVLALGGYLETQFLLTPQELDAQLATGEFRFILIPRVNTPSPLLTWVNHNCRPVSKEVQRSNNKGVATTTPQYNIMDSMLLFDCKEA